METRNDCSIILISFKETEARSLLPATLDHWDSPKVSMDLKEEERKTEPFW